MTIELDHVDAGAEPSEILALEHRIGRSLDPAHRALLHRYDGGSPRHQRFVGVDVEGLAIDLEDFFQSLTP